ncbi:translin-associated protein X-like [Eriocheir sinensis]|uniref:translin-associated protein X-like n=1 Tax=Eriocheir sinensis TaxID=95602 RepID=UPI0021C988F1|nr:translin-associated protein X-like [Eriocheir sinensis]XP_050693618.1 translin-associated protein X-like [Eriocheir sinensis]
MAEVQEPAAKTDLKGSSRELPEACQDSPLMVKFREYSKMLDEKNDKYERIYKTSRDVTVRSKRVIFTLHRIPGVSEDVRESLLSSGANELRDIEQTLMKHIAMELRDEDPHQFVNAYTSGIQEYVEALSFHYFLMSGTIISHSEVQKRVTFGGLAEDQAELVPLNVLLQPKEYILGIADLTGELMRFCIKCVSTGDFDKCYKICDILKTMHGGFLSLGYIPAKELYHKMMVFKSSLHKVEEACYSLQLRKSEVPADMLSDVFAMYDADENNAHFM